MKIGIIGTGNMASGLGKLWADKGHQVLFGSREPEKGKSLAQSAGANARSGTYGEAARFGDVVVFAVPYHAAAEALRAAGSLDGKILIDVTNPLGPDMALVVGHTTSAAEEIAKMARGARVVKAFNHIFAQVFSSGPQFGSDKATVFICGDDADAKTVVSRLASDIGFAPMDAGPLRIARYVEPVAGLVIQLGYGMGMGTGIALALKQR